MKSCSIKYRITFWYTFIIILVFGILLLLAFLYSEHYGENEIKAELLDEIMDLQEDVLRYTDYFPDVPLTSYYDDGVMLSIYNTDYMLINGVVPDEFPHNFPFSQQGIKQVSTNEGNWFVMDEMIFVPKAGVLWLRGIHSYSSILDMIQMLTFSMCIIFPILIAFTTLIGFLMIRHCLKPIQVITDTANEITGTSALARRIPLPNSKDEFYHLTNTFNHMFESLENAFFKERQFSSDAAHELKTPLSVILSHCEYCLDELNPEPEVAKEISSIQQKAQHMSGLVIHLLNIARSERSLSHPEYEWVDLQLLAESVSEELEEKAQQKQIQIQIFQEMENPNILGDLSMLTRLFINLVDNAIIYGREQGYIHIRIQDKQHMVCILFEDNGIGISEENLPKIWNRFFQADSSRSNNKGFGLGLFMVQQIVSCHKGNISVESQLGEGSTFQVELPKI